MHNTTKYPITNRNVINVCSTSRDRRALTDVGALLAAERLAVDSFRAEVRIIADERRA